MRKSEVMAYATERDLREIRDRIDRVLKPQRRSGHQQGWSLYNSAPIQVGKALRHLKQKKDVALYAYQYVSGQNGNAFVFALPGGFALPEPADCAVESEVKSGVEFGVPTPPAALHHFMDAFERPTTIQGYSEASLLMRALQELGAMWHGCSWECETIIDKHPSDFVFRPLSSCGLPNTPRDEWTWSAPEPEDWYGVVKISKDGSAVVRFYTWSPVGVTSVFENIDEYAAGSATAKTRRDCIASGGAGIVF